MTWSRKDIIADIKKVGYNVDITLPYWELRRKYRSVRYRSGYLGTGSWDFASQSMKNPPPTS